MSRFFNVAAVRGALAFLIVGPYVAVSTYRAVRYADADALAALGLHAGVVLGFFLRGPQSRTASES